MAATTSCQKTVEVPEPANTLSIAEFEKLLDAIIKSKQPGQDKVEAVTDLFHRFTGKNESNT